MVKYKNKKNKIKIKPEIVAYYNLSKSGVDLSDMGIIIYSTQRKIKNGGKLFFLYFRYFSKKYIYHL